MIEDELRAAFARHEQDAPDPVTLRGRIDALARRRRRARTGLRVAAAAVAVALAVTGAPLVRDRLADADQLFPAGPSPSTAPEAPATALNLLLLGLDPNSAENGTRTDNVTLVHVPADRQRVYLISVPRDLGVDIPGHGRGKLNAAYGLGGAALTAQVVSGIAGVRIDGTVTVTLDATTRIADQVGPVQVCLTEATKSLHSGRNFPKGCQQLDGAGVSDLLRQRRFYPNGSYERDRTAQRVLLGLVTRLSELNLLTDVARITSLVSSGGNGVEVDLGSGVPTPVQLGWQLRGVDADDVIGFSQPTFNASTEPQHGYEALVPEAAELFSALRAGTLDQFAATHPVWVLQR